MSQNYSQNNEIILCQPDSNKGCSACCGIFNYIHVDKITLENQLQKKSSIPEIQQSIKHRDATSYICPYQGFISNGVPGCTMHPQQRGIDLRDESLYGSHICNEYLCPAHAILNTRQKRILINSVEDWYLYSIAILDSFSLIWMIDHISEVYCSWQDNQYLFKNLLQKALSIHAEKISRYEIPLFYFSLYEYTHSTLACFSPAQDTHYGNKNRHDLINALNRFICTHDHTRT